MPVDSIPPAPWVLHGKAVAFLAPRFRWRLLVKYQQSPVGPYHEHALVILTRRGPSVVQMGVNSEASMLGGRRNWGYPKVLERLSWQSSRRNIVFLRNGKTFRIQKTCLRFPLALPFWTVQELDGQVVRVPATLRGKARLGFRGRQLALILDEFEMRFEAPQPL